MNTNPSLQDVRCGDIFTVATAGSEHQYVGTVVDVQAVEDRFGEPDRILTVKIVTPGGKLVSDSKRVWYSHLRRGI